MQQKHKEAYDAHKTSVINIISLLLGLAASIATYTISSYFKEVAKTDNISFFYVITFAVILVFFLNLHKPIQRYGKSNVLFVSLIFFAMSSLALAFLPVSWIGAVIVMVNIIFYNLTRTEKDIVLEAYSDDKHSGRIRGLNLMVSNIGFVIGAFMSAEILETFGYAGIFGIQFVLIFLLFFISLKYLKDINHNFKKILTVGQLVKKAVKRKDVMHIYLLAFILDFFFCISVVYLPIYLRNFGIEWSELGIILGIMVLPYAIVEYPVGFLADKKTSEKELIMIALMIMGTANLAIFYINSSSLYVWAFVLFSSRVGAAFLDISRDSYFYKRIDGTDVDIIDFFRTARPMAYIVGSIFATIILIFLPIKYLFLMVAFVIFLGFIPALDLSKNELDNEDAITKIKKMK